MIRGFDYSSEVKVPSIVADDWMCRNSLLPVTDIHWWGSYWQTQTAYINYSDGIQFAPNGGIESFRFTIWSDVPSGPNVPFSHPDGPLWTFTAPMAMVQEVPEGYVAYVPGEYVWRYNLTLPEENWFHQTAGTVYWLSIEANLPDTQKQWGWHESWESWGDAAVQSFNGSGWYTLGGGCPTDMAFELTTTTVIPDASCLALATMGFGALGAFGRLRRRR